jgi:hypothetical protein
LYSKYIAKHSEWELNIPDALRENAAAELGNIMGLIKVEMAQDTFKRFCTMLNNDINGVLPKPVQVSAPSTPTLYRTISFKVVPPSTTDTDSSTESSVELVEVSCGSPSV